MSEHPPQLYVKERFPKPPFTLEEAKQFVEENLESLEGGWGAVSTSCIDGRYEKGAGILSMPGGDVGLLAIALAIKEDLGLTREEILEAVFRTIGGGDVEKGKALFHHHHDTHGLNGCGHCARLKQEPDTGEGQKKNRYGLTLDDITFIQFLIKELQASGNHSVELQGDHEERAVFITERVKTLQSVPDTIDPSLGFEEQGIELEDAETITNPDTTHFVLNHKTEEGDQAFVYRRSLVRGRLLQFAKELRPRKNGETNEQYNEAIALLVEKLFAVEQTHLSYTAGDLAKGKPVFYVFIDSNGNKKVVPQRTEKA